MVGFDWTKNVGSRPLALDNQAISKRPFAKFQVLKSDIKFLGPIGGPIQILEKRPNTIFKCIKGIRK
jgi:hypothetical protein